MKHFAELDLPRFTAINGHFTTLADANRAAHDFVSVTGRTATTYSHTKKGRAFRRSVFFMANGKVVKKAF